MSGQGFLEDAAHCQALLSAGQTDDAIAAFEALTVKWSHWADAHALLGNGYIKAGRYADAVKSLQTGIEIDPSHNLSRSNMVAALHALERYTEAIPHIVEVIRTAPSDQVEPLAKLLHDNLTWVNKSPETVSELLCLVTPDQNTEVILSILPYLERVQDHHACLEVYKVLVKLPLNKSIVFERLGYYARLSDTADVADSAAQMLEERLGPYDQQAKIFHSIYDAGMARTVTIPSERRRARFKSLVDHFLLVSHLKGEVAECGMFRGLSAFVLCSLVRAQDPAYKGEDFHGFDSFEGLSPPTAEDEVDGDEKPPAMFEGAFACSEDEVRQHLADFPGINTYPGWIPDRFYEVEDKTFRFVSVDVDLYKPSKDSLEFFYPRMVPGGIIICDDYNWPGQAKAVQEFSDARGLPFSVTEQDQAVFKIPGELSTYAS